MFKLDKTEKQIKALSNAIQLIDNEEEAKLLLELQETLISICETIKSDTM